MAFTGVYDTFRYSGLLLNGAKPNKFIATVWFPIFPTPKKSSSAPGFLGDVIDFVQDSDVLKGTSSVLKTVKTTLSCKQASLPQSTISKVDVPIFGNQKVRVAGDREYNEEFAITVYNDQDFVVRNSVEKWIEKIQDGKEGVGRQISPEDYKSSATVMQLSDSSGGVGGAIAAGATGIGAGLSALSSSGGGLGATLGAVGAAAGSAALGGLGLPFPIYTYKFSGIFPTSIQSIDVDWSKQDEIEEFTINFSYDYFDIDMNAQNLLGSL